MRGEAVRGLQQRLAHTGRQQYADNRTPRRAHQRASRRRARDETRDGNSRRADLLAVELRASTVPPGGLVITLGIGGGIGGA